MQLLEVSCAVRHIYIYMSLGAKGLITAVFGKYVSASFSLNSYGSSFVISRDILNSIFPRLIY